MKKIITAAAIAGALTMGATTASALAAAQTAFNAHYTVQDRHVLLVIQVQQRLKQHIRHLVTLG